MPDTLPRAYAVGRARIADGPAAFEQLVDATFDPAREVILPAPAGGAPEGSSPFSGTARLVELRPDRVRIEADLDQPGYVVLVDAYDPNWTATIDGRPGEVRRANLAFRAVEVPAGRHRIDYRYRPRSVVIGLGITLAAALAGAGLALARLRKPPAPVRAGAAG